MVIDGDQGHCPPTSRYKLISGTAQSKQDMRPQHTPRRQPPKTQVTLSGYQQELPGLGFPVVGEEGERGSLVIDFEVDFPSRLREAHLAALRVVLTEEEIALLEDVLKLMSTRKVRGRCWR